MPKLNIKETINNWKNLDPKKVWLWPTTPKYATMLGGMVAAIVVGYFILIQPELEALKAAQQKMETLKTEYAEKYQVAANLDAYKKMRQEAEIIFEDSLRQLPSKSEMVPLLTDIHQAGLGRGLNFELFKPAAQENMFEFYAELPITIKVEGSYHDIAEFNAAVARLDRIVTLNDIELSLASRQASSGNNRQLENASPNMVMTATAKTYRYLDDTEMKEQKKAAANNKRQNNRRATNRGDQ